ncbi:type I-C CRISPR-associated protein Cas8c/Csd1 [Enterococcus casseliflavus]|uniref:Type I-C CRISPR-associated protein Cas8c/Csd1 n=1 Tax=Enterococcus casseliflavus TaxID=37734 RepID=A0A415EPJ7_ENTCA|nr:type I-C CRISPR-associated protein Cas8c/Csd1 [Enterococcus casseliflavus]
MSWLNDLIETYDDNEALVGINQRTNSGKEVMLLPISHAYQNAHIEVTVTDEGTFYAAKVVPKEEAPTVIPVTISSAGRTSSPAPHGLHDSLQYVAGDFETYGGIYKKVNSYELYIEQLRQWCASEHANPMVQSILLYLEKGQLIKDLVQAGVLYTKDNQLISKWTKEISEEFGEKPQLFQVLSGSGDQSTAFIRFSIHKESQGNLPLWGNPQVIASFINFYNERLPEIGLDYATGKESPLTDTHPSKIRFGGDMAKLISGNDAVNFTYRGRFHNKNQAALLSYEASQKGHNALKWLIAKQGYVVDGRVFLTWGKKEIPRVEESTFEIFNEMYTEDEELEELTKEDTTHQQFADTFSKALKGYRKNTGLDYQDSVQIIILDAATPGRMGILYYQSLEKNLYLKRIEDWHRSCYWKHTYIVKEKKRYTFWGAPSLRDIAQAVHGTNAKDTLIKNTIHELFPCVVDGKKIPLTIVSALFRRASNPVSMENWEWQKTLTIACSIMKKHFEFEKEEQSVALDWENQDRNYLFGRMLAVADVFEERALYQAGVKRSTNAIRYMNAFSAHPVSTWKIIQANLIPYQTRLGTKGSYYQKLLDEIGVVFSEKEYTDQPLNGKFLLGYYSQRSDLNKKQEKNMEE